MAFDLSEKPTPITNKQSSLEISGYDAQDPQILHEKLPQNITKNLNQSNKLDNNRIMNLFNGLQQMKDKQNL